MSPARSLESMVDSLRSRMLIGHMNMSKKTKKISEVFNDMKFDVIVCSEVIEHINKPDFLLKNINVHLKPDGMAILSIPNFKNTNEKGGDPTHIHGWRVSEFKKLLSDNGFKVINHYPTLFNIGKFNITKRKREILFSVFKRVPIKFMMNLMGEQIIFVCVKSE